MLMGKDAASCIENCSFRKYLAELIGTMALVFFGCGSAVLAGGWIGFLGIAFAFGVVVLVMVYAIGPISGCHINPAITIAMWFSKKISTRHAAGYIIFQCIGAIIGAALVFSIATGLPAYDIDENGLGQNGYEDESPASLAANGTAQEGYSMGAAFTAEVVLTFFFILVIFGVVASNGPKGFEGIAIGLTLFIVHLVGIPVTGTSVNPARSLGPALFVGGDAMGQLWLFWLAPIIGGLIAAIVWLYLFDPYYDPPKPVEKPRPKRPMPKMEKKEKEEENEKGPAEEEEGD